MRTCACGHDEDDHPAGGACTEEEWDGVCSCEAHFYPCDCEAFAPDEAAQGGGGAGEP